MGHRIIILPYLITTIFPFFQNVCTKTYFWLPLCFTSSFKLNAKCNIKYQLFFFIVLKFNLHIIAEVKNLTIAPYPNMQKHKVDNVQT